MMPSGTPGQQTMMPSSRPGQHMMMPTGALGQQQQMMIPSGTPRQHMMMPSCRPGQHMMMPSGTPGQHMMMSTAAPGQNTMMIPAGGTQGSYSGTGPVGTLAFPPGMHGQQTRFSGVGRRSRTHTVPVETTTFPPGTLEQHITRSAGATARQRPRAHTRPAETIPWTSAGGQRPVGPTGDLQGGVREGRGVVGTAVPTGRATVLLTGETGEPHLPTEEANVARAGSPVTRKAMVLVKIQRRCCRSRQQLGALLRVRGEKYVTNLIHDFLLLGRQYFVFGKLFFCCCCFLNNLF